MDITDILAEKQQFGEVKTVEIHDVHDFDNAMDELADLNAADEEAKERFDAKVKPWKDFLDQQLEQNEARRKFLQREAYAFVLDHNDDHTLKSARMSTTVKHMSASAKLADRDALLIYAKKNGFSDLITTEESVNAAELKKKADIKVAGDKVIDVDGQVVPGYEITPAHTSVSFTQPKGVK